MHLDNAKNRPGRSVNSIVQPGRKIAYSYTPLNLVSPRCTVNVLILEPTSPEDISVQHILLLYCEYLNPCLSTEFNRLITRPLSPPLHDNRPIEEKTTRDRPYEALATSLFLASAY